MRGQTIQLTGAPDATAIMARLDDDVSIDALTWGGRTTPISLAVDHADQPHLLGDDAVRVVIGTDPYDVEAHTLTLRFPTADEAARFRTKVQAPLGPPVVKDEPETPGFLIQSKGTSEATGEDNSTGSSIVWIHNTNTEIK